jgi:putative endopeptidase
LRLSAALALAATIALGSQFASRASAPPAPLAAKALDTANLDPTCPACKDFFQFATGGWRKHNPIPPAYSSWGRFDTLQEANRAVLHGILETAAKNTNAVPGSREQKIGTFYATCMDARAIDAAGAGPLQPELDRINALGDRSGLAAEAAHLHAIGVDAFFQFGSTQDAKNAAAVIGEFDQSGLGLPDRDYYLAPAEAKTRAAYLRHVAKMFALLGDDPATAATETAAVMALETRLAKAQLDRVTLRDPNATYHIMPVAALAAASPHFGWRTYFAASGIGSLHRLNVSEPAYAAAVSREITATSLADIKTYLRWRLVAAYAAKLAKPFESENFAFNGTVLQGTKEQLPRWERCVAATDNELGEALGAVYVEQIFTPADKARALALVNNLQATLHDDIGALPWMSPKTRAYADYKLAAYAKKIGYPNTFLTYLKYDVGSDGYAANTMRGAVFQRNRDIAKIGKPLDRAQWGMTPPTVNAYYNPALNEIVFPAGILQPPFFNPKADDAINYGAIGAVIGHEMTHGFDDQGSQYDAQGNLRNWWTAADKANFNARAACVVNEFDTLPIMPGLNQTGKLVQGEAIADLGGITIAYRAYQRSLKGKPHPKPIDGYTAEQRFFLGFGQVWAETDRPQYARLLGKTDPHPAPQNRVNGTLANMPEFAAAWNCPASAHMIRPASQQCRIW